VPWQTFVASALLVVVLDLLLVALPCSPMRELSVDATFATVMPSLTFVCNGLELIVLDFVAYAILAVYAARMGFSLLVAAVFGVALGLTITMHLIATAPKRVILPGLPLPVLFASVLMLLVHAVVRPLVAVLVAIRLQASPTDGLLLESATSLLVSGLAVAVGGAAWGVLRLRIESYPQL
jgi:hypothetical protein